MLNQTIFSLINSIAGKYGFIDAVFVFFSVYAIYILYITPFFFRKTKPIISAGVAALAGYAVKLLINYIYPIARPTGTLLIALPSSPSFPSGHSIVGFAIATIVYKHNKKLGVFSLILAGLISISRIFVGVHYPIDVLVGALIGVLCGIAVNYLFKKKK